MTDQPNRYEAFTVVKSVNGAASGLSDAEMEAELKKRQVENVFPFEVFHSEARHFMTEVHQHMDIPRAFLGLSMLSSYSSAIGTGYAIKRTAGNMYMSMWSCFHGMTSSGKSVALDFCYEPLRQIQQGFDHEYVTNKREMEQARRESEERPTYNSMVSHLPSILVRDVHIATMLRTVLPDNPKGVTKEMDELLEWINGMNKTNGQEGIDEQVFLSGWNGSAYRGIRSGRDQFVVPRVFINVVGGIQPDITYKLFKNDRDVTGFIFRILFATSEPRIAIPDATWSMPDGIRESHRKCLHSMFKGIPVHDDFQEPRILEMTTTAARMLQQWKTGKAIAVNAMDDPKQKNIHAGILGKISEYCLRFAGLLAVTDLAYEGRKFATHVEITPAHIERAIKLSEYFYQSAWEVYASQDKTVNAPMEVLRWAVLFKSGKTYKVIAETEYPRDFARNEIAAAKKASRQMRKYITEYPKIFGAVAK